MADIVVSFKSFVPKLYAHVTANINTPKVTANANEPNTNGKYIIITKPPISIIPADIANNNPNCVAFNLASFMPRVAKLNAPIVAKINNPNVKVNPKISFKCVITKPPTKAPNNSIPEVIKTITENSFKLFKTSSFILGIFLFIEPITLPKSVNSASKAFKPTIANGEVIPIIVRALFKSEMDFIPFLTDSNVSKLFIGLISLICVIAFCNNFIFSEISKLSEGILANVVK